MKMTPILDVALMLALLATFVSVAFLRDAPAVVNGHPNTTESK
jgi:hypothetical protein